MTGSADWRPWSSTRSGSARQLPTRWRPPVLGAGSCWSGWVRRRLELSAYALSTEERALIGSFTYSAAEFADTAEWVGTVPDGIGALIDGRVGWEGAPQSFDDLARGRSTASKILVFPHGPPTSGSV